MKTVWFKSLFWSLIYKPFLNFDRETFCFLIDEAFLIFERRTLIQEPFYTVIIPFRPFLYLLFIFDFGTFSDPWLRNFLWFFSEGLLWTQYVSIVKVSYCCKVNFQKASCALLILNILWIFLKVHNFLRHWFLSRLIVTQLEHLFYGGNSLVLFGSKKKKKKKRKKKKRLTIL